LDAHLLAHFSHKYHTIYALIFNDRAIDRRSIPAANMVSHGRQRGHPMAPQLHCWLNYIYSTILLLTTPPFFHQLYKSYFRFWTFFFVHFSKKKRKIEKRVAKSGSHATDVVFIFQMKNT
jgi:hypothetical protein